MKAVFLDYATIGAEALDPGSLFEVMPELEIFDGTAADERAERVRDAEIVLTNKVRLDRELLEIAPQLRLIGLTATGVDNVDLVCAKKRGIAVVNIRNYCSQSVAEHVFAVLLNLTHNTMQYDRSVKAGEWQRAESFCMLKYPIRELSAMTLGIVGYGNLGKTVARLAEQFGMQVLIARRPGTAGVDGDGRTDLGVLIETADVISLHCPLNDDTRGLFGAGQFARMKDDAILINTARGGLVDTAALASALRDGEIGAAAIDVLPQEPPVDGDPLLDYQGDNLIMTPHIAWGTQEARQTAIDQLAAAVRSFLAGGDLNRVV
jgi:glycerate dehydrogenase